MRSILIALVSICTVGNLWAQVPEPVSPTANSSSTQPEYISSFTWTKTSKDNYRAYDSKGVELYELKYLSNLSTDTLAALHLPSRTIVLLPDFDSVAENTTEEGYVLLRNTSKDFYLTNPKSYLTYVGDNSYSPEVTNINGSYVAYIPELDKTYLEKDIRAFPAWGAMNLIDLGDAPDNTFWYRDREDKEYGIIIKGKSMDYSNVTSEMKGDDRLVFDDGSPVYLLEDYANVSSFSFRPVSTNVSAYSATSSNKEEGCVRGDCENGFGKYVYNNGYYDGFWIAGQKTGYGLYSWDNGGTYVGEWSFGEMNGYGVYTAENDDLQKGIFSNGKLNGRAVKQTGGEWEQGVYSSGNLDVAYTFYGNDSETGCTIGDCKNKYGKFVFENGDTYVGFFRNGNLDMGTYSFASGAKYSGQFNSSGQFAGMGRFWSAEGDYYGGQWDNGKYHGRGYFSEKESGTTKIGRFENGVFKEDL